MLTVPWGETVSAKSTELLFRAFYFIILATTFRANMQNHGCNEFKNHLWMHTHPSLTFPHLKRVVLKLSDLATKAQTNKRYD